MENITLKIDQETQDLVLDDSGSLELIGDAETVLRTAIFQETNVQYIDSLTVTRSGRSIAATFTGRLKDGTPISLEVKA